MNDQISKLLSNVYGQKSSKRFIMLFSGLTSMLFYIILFFLQIFFPILGLPLDFEQLLKIPNYLMIAATGLAGVSIGEYLKFKK